jgi:hypothetical protein
MAQSASTNWANASCNSVSVNCTWTITGGIAASYGFKYGSNSYGVGSFPAGGSTTKTTYCTLPIGTWAIKAYITSVLGTTYGGVINITVTAVPTVVTAVPLNVTMIGATLAATVISAGGLTVTSRGVMLNGVDHPQGSGTGYFTHDVTGLQEGTQYTANSYAINSCGRQNGSDVVFTTASRPILTTQAVTNITYSGATGNGTVTGDGLATVTDRGICWSTTQNPTTGNTHTHNGSGLGIYTSPITGLTQGQTYYVRAWAKNIWGVGYGTQVSFVAGIIAPILSGGTDVHLFPLIGWSGQTQVSTWTGATHQRWYSKVSTDLNYTLVKTLGISTGNTTNYLVLKPNINYSFYTTFYKTGQESPASNVVTINNVVSPPTADYSSILII